MWKNSRNNNSSNQTVDSKEGSKKRISVANECFARWNEEITILANKSSLTPKEERRLAKLEKLLLGSEEYECFFPARKMPIYQDIISGNFMRRTQAEKLLFQEKQQPIKEKYKC